MPEREPTEMLPKVSIALCTYNGARFLPAQLESLFAQDYPDLEIVVCDDGSTDGTRELLERHRSDTFRVHFNEVNVGYNRNFDQCFDRCGGSLIAPCDQDDIWAINKISALVDALADADLVYCDSELTDADAISTGERMSDRHVMFSGTVPLGLVLNNCISGHASLFRKALLDRARPLPYDIYYDWWLAFVAASYRGVTYLDTPLVRFRRHESAVSARKAAGKDGAYKLHRYHRQLEQFRRFAALPGGPRNAPVREFAALWAEREQQWFSPKLARFIDQHAATLYGRESDPVAVGRRKRIEHLAGLRLKRLFAPSAYRADQ